MLNYPFGVVSHRLRSTALRQTVGLGLVMMVLMLLLCYFADITCVNESCDFVRKVIHILGYELRSTAVCTHLQRQSDSVFTHSDKHTLLGHQISLNSVIASMKYCQGLLNQGVLQPRKYYQTTTVKFNDLPSTETGIDSNEPAVNKLIEVSDS